MTQTAQFWIKNLKLSSHPEGGYFKENYRCNELISKASLPKRFSGDRCFSTQIYYLLQNSDFSSFHRLLVDETWHFYDGNTLTLHMISADGIYSQQKLGKNIDKGEAIQFVIPAQTWLAADLEHKDNSYALTGCTCAPGFDFEDFQMADREKLSQEFPDHKEIITKLTGL